METDTTNATGVLTPTITIPTVHITLCCILICIHSCCQIRTQPCTSLVSTRPCRSRAGWPRCTRQTRLILDNGTRSAAPWHPLKLTNSRQVSSDDRSALMPTSSWNPPIQSATRRSATIPLPNKSFAPRKSQNAGFSKPVFEPGHFKLPRQANFLNPCQTGISLSESTASLRDAAGTFSNAHKAARRILKGHAKTAVATGRSWQC